MFIKYKRFMSQMFLLIDYPRNANLGQLWACYSINLNQCSVFRFVQHEEFKKDNPLCVAAILHNQISFLRSRLSFNNDPAKMLFSYVTFST